jgi:Acetyltransferase (GNAT) domain
MLVRFTSPFFCFDKVVVNFTNFIKNIFTKYSMDYRIEKITPKHFKDLQFLFLHCFKKNIALSYFEKKFDTKVTGIEVIGYIAYTTDGFPVASHGLYTCKISYKDQEYLAAISGDSMTHSDHRGKGLFDTLARKTNLLAKDSGIKFMYCFPNQYTLSGSKKVDWQYTDGEVMVTHTLKISTLPLAKLARKNSIFNAIYKKYVDFVFSFYKKNAASFPNSFMGSDYGFVIHNQDYFLYKTYSHNTIINIANCNTWLKVDGELKIGDIEIRKDINVNAFVKKIKFIAFLIGCTEIQTTVCKESEMNTLLSKQFTALETFFIGRMDFGLDFEKEKVKFVMGDFDSF